MVGKGIDVHGEDAIAALFKEFKQLNNGAVEGKPVIQPINPNDITAEERKRALDVIMVIKENRDNTLKGRACADGR